MILSRKAWRSTDWKGIKRNELGKGTCWEKERVLGMGEREEERGVTGRGDAEDIKLIGEDESEEESVGDGWLELNLRMGPCGGSMACCSQPALAKHRSVGALDSSMPATRLNCSNPRYPATQQNRPSKWIQPPMPAFMRAGGRRDLGLLHVRVPPQKLPLRQIPRVSTLF